MNEKKTGELPAEIWLQVDQESPDIDDCTWCRDKINDTDVRYVRAESAASVQSHRVEGESEALQERYNFVLSACRDAQDMASRYAWALHDIAGMDPEGWRADDLGRASKAARDALLGRRNAGAWLMPCDDCEHPTLCANFPDQHRTCASLPAPVPADGGIAVSDEDREDLIAAADYLSVDGAVLDVKDGRRCAALLRKLAAAPTVSLPVADCGVEAGEKARQAMLVALDALEVAQAGLDHGLRGELLAEWLNQPETNVRVPAGTAGVEVRQRAKPVKFRMQWGPGETEYASWLPVGAPTSPAWCPVHQHRKWCEHNGGVMGPNGWEAPHGVEGRTK